MSQRCTLAVPPCLCVSCPDAHPGGWLPGGTADPGCVYLCSLRIRGAGAQEGP